MKIVDKMLLSMFSITEELAPKERNKYIKDFFFVSNSTLQKDMEYYYPFIRQKNDNLFKILFLTMLSNYYIFCENKNRQMDKNQGNPLEMFLDKIWSVADFLPMFKGSEYEALLDLIIEANEKIYASHYLYLCLLKKGIIESEKIQKAVKINPYLSLELITADQITLTSSEFIIAEVIEMYNNLLESSEEYETESEQSSEEENLVSNYLLLRDEIVQYYVTDENRLSEVILYMIASIIENSAVSSSLKNEQKELLKAIDDMGKEKLCENFLEDDDFGELICEYFVMYNERIQYSRIRAMRKKIKQQEELETIKEINPFYQEEERIWQKRISL